MLSQPLRPGFRQDRAARWNILIIHGVEEGEQPATSQLKTVTQCSATVRMFVDLNCRSEYVQAQRAVIVRQIAAFEPVPSKIALVSGGNKGIGKEIVRGLAQKGVTVLLGARDPAAGKKAASELAADGSVHFLQLDVTSDSSVSAAAESISSQFGTLDILVNNAGVADPGLGENAPRVEKLKKVCETNVFGVLRLIDAMLPLLKKADGGANIVNVTSKLSSFAGGAGTHLPAFTMPYTVSKIALNGMTVHLAVQLKDDGIRVNCTCPGHCATDLNNHSGPRSATEGAEVPIQLALLEAGGPTGEFIDHTGKVPW